MTHHPNAPRTVARGWAVVLMLAAWQALPPVLGCAPGGGDAVEAGPAQATLAAIGPSVITPELDQLRAEVTALRAAAAAWASGDPSDDAALQAARDAWTTVMARWQRLEVMQIGPAGSSLSVAGGEDLRDLIYAWPSENRCRVDQETVNQAWADPAWFDTALVSVQGLTALEAVLFADPASNGCPAHTEPNASGAWAALGDDGVLALRAGFAVALTDRLDAVVAQLAKAWAADGGDFGARLALGDGSPYTGEAQALQAVYDALFYLETSTKDRKLARPLGLPPCTTEACLDGVESPLAARSHAWIAENLGGFRALYTGGDGPGLDELLVDLGHADLADDFAAALDAADLAAANLDRPLEIAVGEDRAQVEAAHAAIKALTDLVKLDLTTVLQVTVPAEAAGDND
jgi:predicted lipoprotein